VSVRPSGKEKDTKARAGLLPGLWLVCLWERHCLSGLVMNWQDAEKLACEILRREGWDAHRVKDRQGNWSRGPFDVIATKNGRYRFIQVKLRRWENPHQVGTSLADWYRRKFKPAPHANVEVWIFYPTGRHYNVLRIPA